MSVQREFCASVVAVVSDVSLKDLIQVTTNTCLLWRSVDCQMQRFPVRFEDLCGYFIIFLTLHSVTSYNLSN